MVLLEKVDVLEEHDWQINSANHKIPAPSVIRLKDRTVVISKFLKFSRINIYARDKSVCQYCSEKFSNTKLTLDHVIPKSLGGRTTWENIATCCQKCNFEKADRTPHQAKMKLIKKPTYPSSISLIDKYCSKQVPVNWNFYLRRA